MTEAPGRSAPARAGAPSAPPADKRRLLVILIVLGIASTTLHYGHNFVYAEQYPPVPLFFPTPLAYRIGIAVFFPVLTAALLWGYRQYTLGRWTRARWALIAYAPLGMSTPGHFLGGMVYIEPFWFATIFTDFLTGLSILLFALLVIPRTRPAAPGA